MCDGFWPKQGDVRRFPAREGRSAGNPVLTSRASCQTQRRITAHRARRAIEQQRRRRPMRNRAALGPAGGWHRAGGRAVPGPAGGWRRGRQADGAVRRRARHAIKRSRKPAGSPHDDGRIGTGGSTVRRCASGPTRHQLGALPPRAQRAALIRFALIKLPAGSIRAGLWRAGSRGGLSCCRCSPACRAARTPGSRCLPASS